jgi:hypothetical protein
VWLDLGRGTTIVAHELSELTAVAVARFFTLAYTAEGGGGEWRGKRAGERHGGLEGAVT